MNRKFWTTLAQHQGQIVEIRQPQVAGRAEGEEGQVKGLRLAVDHSDQSWALTRKNKAVASGKGNPPTVDEAIAMLAKK